MIGAAILVVVYAILAILVCAGKSDRPRRGQEVWVAGTPHPRFRR